LTIEFVGDRGHRRADDGPWTLTAANFTCAASKRKTDAELFAIIENGRPAAVMAGWKGQLSDVEIQDVLA
jgi:hypothetical protein